MTGPHGKYAGVMDFGGHENFGGIGGGGGGAGGGGPAGAFGKAKVMKGGQGKAKMKPGPIKRLNKGAPTAVPV